MNNPHTEITANTNSKKNILLLINNLTGGGAELVVCNLCRHINRELFNVAVCHLKERGYRGDVLLAEGYDIVGLPGYNPSKTNYFTFLELRKLLKQKNIDLVHSHSTDALLDLALNKCFSKRLKAVHTFHYGNYPNYEKKYLMLEKIAWRKTDIVVAVGNEQRRAVTTTFGIPKDRIVTVWNGVEPNKPALETELMNFLPKNKLIIGSLSTCIPQKGLHYLLDVIHQLKRKRNDFALLLVGDGPLRKELEERSREMGLSDTIIFLGWVANAPSTILPAFDIFIQSSLWEAMSMVILEAMAAGKAIVATDVGENKHVLNHGVSGFLTQPKDVKGMVQSVELLLDNQNLRNSIGQKASETFNQLFTVDLMARNYEKLYQKLLS
jgi:glycosyltransferase involved in cell wall biosynthesis